jgi:hypothetical protein
MSEYSMTAGQVAYLQYLMRLPQAETDAHPWWHELTPERHADWNAIADAVIAWRETGVANLTRPGE